MDTIDRRTFLKTGAGVAAATTSGLGILGGSEVSAAPQGAPAIVAGLPDVVVIGAGAFGGWTALTLRERGAKVTLLDAYAPGNPRQTSADETREIRTSYGDREIYTRWALKAFGLWKAREQEWNRKLLHPCGRLQLAPAMTPEMEAQKAIFDRLAIPHELLGHDELRRRYPQVGFDGVDVAFFEPGAAIARARDAIVTVAEMFERKGGTVRIAQAMPGRAEGRRLTTVALGGGESVSAGAVVFACGPWLRKMFPAFLGTRISTGRAEVFYIGTPAGDTRFTCPNLPVLTEPSRAYYALPCVDTGVKMSPNAGSVMEVDPDTQEHIVSPYLEKRARELVTLRYPALKDQPIVHTRISQMESSPDLHFIIDRHPDYDNAWIAGAGSAHGFKHGPVIGEYVADRVAGRPGDPELEKVFALKGRPERPPVRVII